MPFHAFLNELLPVIRVVARIVLRGRVGRRRSVGRGGGFGADKFADESVPRRKSQLMGALLGP